MVLLRESVVGQWGTETARSRRPLSAERSTASMPATAAAAGQTGAGLSALRLTMSVGASPSAAASSIPRKARTGAPAGYGASECGGDTCREEPPASSRRAVDISRRSEEHTSELQSLMRISYAV